MKLTADYWQKIYQLHNVKNTDNIILFGVEGMEQIFALRGIISEENNLILIVHDEEIAKYAFQILPERTRNYVITPEKSAHSVILGMSAEMGLGRCVVIPATLCVRANADIYAELFKDLRDTLINVMSGLITAIVMPSQSLHNTVGNGKDICRYPSTTILKDAHKGLTGVVISAGPSLDNNLDWLKRNQGNAVYFATIPTLKKLLENGINPQYACIVDYHALSKSFTKGLPASDTVLITDPKASALANKSFRGNKVFNIDSISLRLFPERYESEPFLEHVTTGTSVAEYAHNLAIYTGCEKVVFVGQDFCWTGEKTHSKGVSAPERFKGDMNGWTEFEIAVVVNRNNQDTDALVTKNIAGESVLTNGQFVAYKNNMEAVIKENPLVKHYNMSEGLEIVGAETVKDYQIDAPSEPVKAVEVKRNNNTVNTKTLNKIRKEVKETKRNLERVLEFSKSIILEDKAGRDVTPIKRDMVTFLERLTADSKIVNDTKCEYAFPMHHADLIDDVAQRGFMRAKMYDKELRASGIKAEDGAIECVKRDYTTIQHYIRAIEVIDKIIKESK